MITITYTTEDGFKWGVISFYEAKQRFLNNKEVFKLYQDGSESLCVESDFEYPEEDVCYAYEIGFAS